MTTEHPWDLQTWVHKCSVEGRGEYLKCLTWQYWQTSQPSYCTFGESQLQTLSKESGKNYRTLVLCPAGAGCPAVPPTQKSQKFAWGLHWRRTWAKGFCSLLAILSHGRACDGLTAIPFQVFWVQETNRPSAQAGQSKKSCACWPRS